MGAQPVPHDPGRPEPSGHAFLRALVASTEFEARQALPAHGKRLAGDLSPLADLDRLQALDLDDTQVSDLAPLVPWGWRSPAMLKLEGNPIDCEAQARPSASARG